MAILQTCNSKTFQAIGKLNLMYLVHKRIPRKLKKRLKKEGERFRNGWPLMKIRYVKPNINDKIPDNFIACD